MPEAELANVFDVALAPVTAHGGEGEIGFARLLERAGHDHQTMWNFVDVAALPPGTSIGRHRHDTDQEEFYLVLTGSGTIFRDGFELAVRSGDVVRNRPGGVHELRNSGDGELRIFVFELRFGVSS